MADAAAEEIEFLEEGELPPAHTRRCAGRRWRPDPASFRKKPTPDWRRAVRVALWIGALLLALALVSQPALAAQEPPPEWDTYLAAGLARGHASKCLAEEVPATLWDAYQMARKTAFERTRNLNSAAGPALMGQMMRGEVTPHKYMEEVERRAPDVYGQSWVANEALLAAQEALKLAAPKRWAALEAAEQMLTAASVALGRVMYEPAPPHWEIPEPSNWPCR